VLIGIFIAAKDFVPLSRTRIPSKMTLTMKTALSWVWPLGFVVLTLGIASVLMPDTFFSKSSPSTALDSQVTLQSGERNADPKADAAPVSSDSVQYAPGYGPDDFKNFDPPADPRIDENGQLIQPGGPWKTLLKLRFDTRYNHQTEDVDYVPMFTPEIKGLEGKVLELEGFIIPHELARTNQSKGTMFMFSAFPAASCFFCGAAGPESIVEVYPKKPIPYTKEQTKIRGRLKLNASDPLRMAYILEQAEAVY
jgi:hypothetical protein